ncbi:MAG: hypothetical protein DME85_08960 [Verrucomicrobia bacterium]|nr:MAG: hypothetical protein DME85_08960 [Verrucomicrobiota bacterium]
MAFDLLEVYGFCRVVHATRWQRACRSKNGVSLTFDTGDARRSAGQSPEYFAKFFASGCHVTLVARENIESELR